MRRIMEFFKELFGQIRDDEVSVRAASVAYYAALSLAPMVLLFIAITGFIGEDAQQRMIETVSRTVGEHAGESIRMIAGEDVRRRAGIGLAVSLAVILFAASRVMVGLQMGLNRVWHVKTSRGPGWKNWIRKRVLSIGMVLGVVFLLLVSMVASTMIAMVLPSEAWIWNLVTLAISFAVFTLLFAAIFKILPDVEIAWRDVWVGALVTALLFSAGKELVGLYLGRAGVAGSYGAAGSLIVMLIWVYFSALILFVGSEITQIVARRSGRPIVPNEHAVRVKQVEEPRGDAARA